MSAATVSIFSPSERFSTRSGNLSSFCKGFVVGVGSVPLTPLSVAVTPLCWLRWSKWSLLFGVTSVPPTSSSAPSLLVTPLSSWDPKSLLEPLDRFGDDLGGGELCAVILVFEGPLQAGNGLFLLLLGDGELATRSPKPCHLIYNSQFSFCFL